MCQNEFRCSHCQCNSKLIDDDVYHWHRELNFELRSSFFFVCLLLFVFTDKVNNEPERTYAERVEICWCCCCYFHSSASLNHQLHSTILLFFRWHTAEKRQERQNKRIQFNAYQQFFFVLYYLVDSRYFTLFDAHNVHIINRFDFVHSIYGE